MEGNFNIGDGNVDDDDDEDDNLFDHDDFEPITTSHVTIVSNLLDDLFTGRASKMRFQREAGQENLRFILGRKKILKNLVLIIPIKKIKSHTKVLHILLFN